jgi:hypothetical protein
VSPYFSLGLGSNGCEDRRLIDGGDVQSWTE